MRKFVIIFSLLFILSFIFTGCGNKDLTDIEDDFSITYSVTEAKEALDFALSREGKPYVWGGNGPDEFDCSGLIVWSYRRVNPDAKFKIGNRYFSDAAMDDFYNFNVVSIHPSELRPGDIVFITHDPDRITHGGLFIDWIDDGTFRFVHASSADSGKGVVIDSWEIGKSGYGYQWFAGAGRLKKYEY